MKDVEKVIAAYECKLDIGNGRKCSNCPYGYSRPIDFGMWGAWRCDVSAILDDAVEILIQQNSTDATPTYWVKETDRTNHWHCPKCGYTVGLADMWDNYCPKCGIRIARKEGEKLDF